MEKNLLASLNDLVTDTRFRKLAITQNFESIMNEYGINESENATVLSWLLNPKGSHGLQDLFLKEMMTAAWSMIASSTRPEYKVFKTWSFFNQISPLSIQEGSYREAHLDREVKREYRGADMVITDDSQKIMIVLNNRFDKADCDKAYKHFSGKEYACFENKIFISLDAEVQTLETSTWMYMNNEWIINLCTTILEQGTEKKAIRYVADLYQLLTGSAYGEAAQEVREACATLVAAYSQTLVDLKNYKSERVPGKALITVNPREYAVATQGKGSKMDQEILSLYWTYRNTFNTFFQMVEMEGVTRLLDKAVEKKSYAFERTLTRNGLSYSPKFSHLGFQQEIMNQIFDVELTQDWNKNYCLNVVVNKVAWDKLTVSQRDVIQKNLDWTGTISQDRTTVWSKYYKAEQKGDFSKEISGWFERIEGYVKTTFVKAA
jgi:hypothetical protein